MIIKISDEVKYIIETLESNGYEAYAVGGCVRDSLLGNSPADWDICTFALPGQTMACFDDKDIIKTGLKHGTVTLILNNRPFEITTYRRECDYTDNRHPDKVEFIGDLKEDLSRRDFTVNAMAYNPTRGLVDFFGGIDDLDRKVIKCVGEADKRFSEDALRIMRALRFAAVLGFRIDGDTAKAMRGNKELLKNISVERIAGELNKLIMGDGAGGLLTEHKSIITEIIPGLTSDLKSIDSVPKDLYIRLAALLRDTGEAQLGAYAAQGVLTRLKYDKNTIAAVTQLIMYRDAEIFPGRTDIKRWLNNIGEGQLRRLIEVKRSDVLAQSESRRHNQLDKLEEAEALLNEIIDKRLCFSLKDLAVNGKDLIAVGIPEGGEIGVILKKLTDMVIDEKVENNKQKLLAEVRSAR